MDAPDLETLRRVAAEASGGTSGPVVRNTIVRILEELSSPESLLDFGAGTGDLLKLLRDKYPQAHLSGIDYFSRPTDLPDAIEWKQQDLNEEVALGKNFDIIICSEVIEHLENPRATMRCMFKFLKRGGHLILTIPNQECIRGYAALIFGGHFWAFLGECYPAHITALLRLDLVRMCAECGFLPPRFHYGGQGCIPKMAGLTWQKLSFGLLTGRLFSDNLIMVAVKP